MSLLQWSSADLSPAASSILFDPSQRNAVIASNIGLLSVGALVIYACTKLGTLFVVNAYVIPWVLVTHWFIMITYLHHTDPTLPHFRTGAWTFARGASATVDRDFLGWQGRFFLHDGEWRFVQSRSS